MKETEQWNNFR